jgi:hypothetical protein
VARQLGCRLPTTNEWIAALKQMTDPLPNDQIMQRLRPNVRDVTFGNQLAWRNGEQKRIFKKLDDEVKRIDPNANAPPVDTPYPDWGSYSNKDKGKPHATMPNDYHDRILWFSSVASADQEGMKFKHLVGNVAEFVCDKPVVIEELNADQAGLLSTIQAKLKVAGVKVSIIGGSALSDPSIPFDNETSVTPGSAYADVGFRLAFTGSRALSLAQRIKAILDDEHQNWYAVAAK